jgi:predicted Zn-dependent protease
MKKNKTRWHVLAITALLFQACSSVPITGRRQLSLVPDGEMLSASYAQYNQFKRENKLSSNKAQTNMVRQVGRRIQGAVTAYFAQRNLSRSLKGFRWEFNLFENPQVNAWCMPGGKVAVYTGILPVTQNETGLAVVIGHEVAHAVAKHSNERMSQALIAQLGGQALSAALKEKPKQTRDIWMSLFGIGVTVGAILPYSRLQENEADHLGLIFQAMAGYDPRAAVGFWQRMAKNAGPKPPEFLSTHPADAARIENINALIPEAMKYYRR